MLKYTAITIFLFSLSYSTICQNKYYNHIEEVIDEKVRDKSIKKYILNAWEDYKNNDLQSILKHQNDLESYLENNQINPKSSNNFGFGAEPFIAINPLNMNHIVVTYMEQVGSTLDMPVYYSFDGGLNWTKSIFSTLQTLNNLGKQSLGGGDPVFVFDANGTLHMTWLYLNGNLLNLKLSMFYAYSTDGGITFNIPSDINDHIVYEGSLFSGDLIDRQWMTVDKTNGPHHGNVYLSAIYLGNKLSNPGQIVMVKPPLNNGFLDTAIAAVPKIGNNATQFGNVLVDELGTVHLSCMVFQQSTGVGGVYYTKSTDGANSFSFPQKIADAKTTLPNSSGHLVHSRDNSAVSLAVDNHNIYIAWSDMSNNDVHSFYALSHNRGDNWTLPIEFGDSVSMGNYYHLMPNISADSGYLSISWYRVDRSSYLSDYLLLHSIDSGLTLSNYQVISNNYTDFSGAQTSSDFYGDYNTSVQMGCDIFSIWCDGSSGNTNVYLVKKNHCISTPVELFPINSLQYSFNIYPNPVKETLQIQIESTQINELDIKIFNTKGVLLIYEKTPIEKGKKLYPINLPDLAAGMYILNIRDELGIINTRIFNVVK